MAPGNCVVKGCKTTLLNKGPATNFHPCPSSLEMRNKWLQILKNRCTILDWARSRICSKHFENKYFDAQRRLKPNAVPTLFPAMGADSSKTFVKNTNSSSSKLDKALSRMTQAELMSDVKLTLLRMKEPINLSEFVYDDMKCKPDAPMEAKLWVLIKKQEYLNNLLTEAVVKNNRNLEVLQKNMTDNKSGRKEMEQNTENYKYIIKCLQEKQATLEEQVEILTAVESR
ncbi:uncharacterized protein LOC125231039 [Leguminivora glycinivorella]|uniref:uncharacterized protein LOC125231039 n=1 Tax=Leguminivora glycinivorella TaxID=1035111 RepID=UPI00200CD12A|nr:uncharacterized protein LOC125231039 [Leguminivora glycinivorella]